MAGGRWGHGDTWRTHVTGWAWLRGHEVSGSVVPLAAAVAVDACAADTAATGRQALVIDVHVRTDTTAG
eukprot:m.784359 g.784359  ORF g.784359 m.784359 type:complete len:69 (-) comp23298_c3_seq3:184-390(-)